MIAAMLLAVLVSGPTAFRVNPAQAEAGFDLKATLHTVHGKTTRVSGEVRAVPGDGGALAFSGTIEVAAATLDTANAKRDAKMRGDCLAVDRFPALVFEPERFAPGPAPVAADGATAGTLTGRLTIRGVTKPAALAVTLKPSGGGIVVEGTFDVAWADFGVPDPSFLFVRIDPVAHARVRAEFVPVP